MKYEAKQFAQLGSKKYFI